MGFVLCSKTQGSSLVDPAINLVLQPPVTGIDLKFPSVSFSIRVSFS